jgi:hypothetical protein
MTPFGVGLLRRDRCQDRHAEPGGVSKGERRTNPGSDLFPCGDGRVPIRLPERSSSACPPNRSLAPRSPPTATASHQLPLALRSTGYKIDRYWCRPGWAGGATANGSAKSCSNSSTLSNTTSLKPAHIDLLVRHHRRHDPLAAPDRPSRTGARSPRTSTGNEPGNHSSRTTRTLDTRTSSSAQGKSR